MVSPQDLVKELIPAGITTRTQMPKTAMSGKSFIVTGSSLSKSPMSMSPGLVNLFPELELNPKQGSTAKVTQLSTSEPFSEIVNSAIVLPVLF